VANLEPHSEVMKISLLVCLCRVIGTTDFCVQRTALRHLQTRQ